MNEVAVQSGGVPGKHEMWLAGGTTVVDLMKLGVLRTNGLVSLADRRKELSGIELVDGGVMLGAMTRMAEAERHTIIRDRYPAVHLALALAASPQIREMATLGGNLLQRTRCSYFRDGRSACNKRDPGTGCSAIGGDETGLAILGRSSQCIASYPGDLAVALTLMKGVVATEGRDGNRKTLPIADLYCLPGKTPHIENRLEQGDLITEIRLPDHHWTGQSYVKLRDRASYAFASASAAVAVKLVDGCVVDARIVLGGLSSIPWVCEQVVGMLIGQKLDDWLAVAAGDACFRNENVPTGHEYRAQLGARAVARALMDACRRTR
jgi:xanthine dehydrogenase YagS FAD-binding subunit